MTQSQLEHVNVTVSDPLQTANRLCALFDWEIRWQGAAKNGGHTVHVGSKDTYLAVYSQGTTPATQGSSFDLRGGLNHIGIVVDDLNHIEARVIKAGYTPHSHADYEPGQRFYFDDEDEIEFEVVSYNTA